MMSPHIVFKKRSIRTTCHSPTSHRREEVMMPLSFRFFKEKQASSPNPLFIGSIHTPMSITYFHVKEKEVMMPLYVFKEKR